MKVKLTFLFILYSTMVLAQDIVVTKDSQRLDVKIEEVSNEQIKYRKMNNLEGPLFIMPTNEIQTIIYANGDVQIFNANKTQKKKPVTVLKDPIEKTRTHERVNIKRWFGITLGWVFRDRMTNIGKFYSSDVHDDYINNQYFVLDNYKVQSLGNTLQIGFTFSPTFGNVGLGLYSGLYFEHTWAMKQISTWNPNHIGNVNCSEELRTGKLVITKESYDNNGKRIKWFGAYENALFLPIHFQYKYNFNPNMSVSASAGVSLVFGLDNDSYYSYPSHVNVLLGTRCGFQLYGIQVSLVSDWSISPEKVTYDISLKHDMSSNLTITTPCFYHRPISVQLSYMF